MHAKGVKLAELNALLIFRVWGRKLLVFCARLLVRFQTCSPPRG
jgi:hypothetical protein